MKYFVSFQAECNGDMLISDVIDLDKEINSLGDIRNVETLLGEKWFGDDRELTLVNFIKLT